MTVTRIAITAAVMLVASAHLQASALVVFRTENHVVLAVDSLVSWGDGRRSLTCKIGHGGRWVFVSGGYSDGGSIKADTGKALAHARTLTEAGQLFRRDVFPSIFKRLEAARHTPEFAALFAVDEIVHMTVIAGFNEGDDVPRVGIFNSTLKKVEPFEMGAGFFECPGDVLCPDGKVLFGSTMAADGPIITLLAPPRPPWIETGEASSARRLIAMQIEQTPRDVGGPIETIAITKSGASWVERDPASLCQASTH